MMPTRLVVVTICLVISGGPSRTYSTLNAFRPGKPGASQKRTLPKGARCRLAACGQTSRAPPAQMRLTFRPAALQRAARMCGRSRSQSSSYARSPRTSRASPICRWASIRTNRRSAGTPGRSRRPAATSTVTRGRSISARSASTRIRSTSTSSRSSTRCSVFPNGRRVSRACCAGSRAAPCSRRSRGASSKSAACGSTCSCASRSRRGCSRYRAFRSR